MTYANCGSQGRGKLIQRMLNDKDYRTDVLMGLKFDDFNIRPDIVPLDINRSVNSRSMTGGYRP